MANVTKNTKVNEKETFIIEVHDFYSCGLYGFNQLNRLPYMFWSSHLKKLIKNERKTCYVKKR